MTNPRKDGARDSGDDLHSVPQVETCYAQLARPHALPTSASYTRDIRTDNDKFPDRYG